MNESYDLVIVMIKNSEESVRAVAQLLLFLKMIYCLIKIWRGAYIKHASY